MICVIDRKNTTIRYQSGCLLLRQKDDKARSIPISQIEQVIVYGNPLAETAVWRHLAEAAVPVVMLAARGRPQTAMLGSGLAVRLPLRRLQHRLADRPMSRVAMARWFVDKKITGYDLPMATLEELYPIRSRTRTLFANRLRLARHQLAHAATVSEVMGVEGGLAQAWFGLLASTLPVRFRFRGRNRRPPRDPVNAMLSLGYTLLLAEVRQALLIDGFDPSLGYLHQEYPGREALALDFQEIFRLAVDNFVLRFLGQIPNDNSAFYYRKEEGCRMTKGFRPIFYQSWARLREEWPRYDDPDRSRQCAPVRELLLGQTAEARRYMEKLEESDEETAP